jgi:hypothetical protein
MRPLFKDALKYAIPAAAILTVIVTVGSWLNGGNVATNYFFGVLGGVYGFGIGFVFGLVESSHTLRKEG